MPGLEPAIRNSSPPLQRSVWFRLSGPEHEALNTQPCTSNPLKGSVFLVICLGLRVRGLFRVLSSEPLTLDLEPLKPCNGSGFGVFVLRVYWALEYHTLILFS